MEKLQNQLADIQLTNFPVCIAHNQKVKIYCQHQKCDENKLGCGECMIDFHFEHGEQVVKLDKIFDYLNKVYKQMINLNIQFPNSNDEIIDFDLNLQQYIDDKKKLLISSFEQDLNCFFKQYTDQKNLMIYKIKHPTIKYQSLSNEFKNDENYKKIKLFEHQIDLVIQLNSQIDDILKESSMYLKIDFESIKKNIQQKISEFEQEQQKRQRNFIMEMNQCLDNLKQQKLQAFNFIWSKTQQNHIRFIDEKTITPISGCSSEIYVLSNETIPNQNVYFEVLKNDSRGCNDSLGLCLKKDISYRNGANEFGWAVRLYGKHLDYSFTGSIHNGKSDKFYDQWKVNDRIGILYNSQKKEISYFVNGKFIGTPFTNVQGQLFVCMELCCDQKYSIIQDPNLPSFDDLKNLL